MKRIDDSRKQGRQSQPGRDPAVAAKKPYEPPQILSHEGIEVVAGYCQKANFGEGGCGTVSPLAS